MEKNGMEAFSDGVFAVIYSALGRRDIVRAGGRVMAGARPSHRTRAGRME